MRVVFLGQSGPYAPYALRALLGAGRAHPDPWEVVLVVEGVQEAPGRGAHRVRKPHHSSVHDAESLCQSALSRGVPVLQSCNVNEGEAVRHIADHRPDALVCVGFDRLFGLELLTTAPIARINVHPSLLPDLRGPSPIFWMARRGDRTLGITIHEMDPGEDHGIIYRQTEVARPPMATGDELYRLAAEVAAPFLCEVLAELAAGNLRGLAQPHRQATRAPRPKPEDARFQPEEWGAQHLVEFCSAARFFRAAWTRFGEQTFFARRGVKAELGRTLPGQYIQKNELLLVQCQDGVAHLEIQV